MLAGMLTVILHSTGYKKGGHLELNGIQELLINVQFPSLGGIDSHGLVALLQAAA